MCLFAFMPTLAQNNSPEKILVQIEPATAQDVNLSPLKISIIKENPPLSMLLPDGEPTGLYVDFWKLWSEVNNTPIVFEPTSFMENIAALKRSEERRVGKEW